MRILVVYRGLPWPISEGNHLRILHIFRRLATRHEIHLLALVHDEKQALRRPALEKEGIFSSIHLEQLPPRNWKGRLRTNLGLEPAAALRAEYPGFQARLRSLVRELKETRRLDVAYTFDTWVQVLFQQAMLLPALCDFCDSRSLFFARRLERHAMPRMERWRTRQLHRRFLGLERFLLRHYPVSTTVSHADREHLRSLVPEAAVEVIPNGVDLEMFAPRPGVEQKPGNLIFFGNMDYLPNVEAAQRLVRDILPRVQRTHPEASLTLAGTQPLPQIRALESEAAGVEVTGTVPEIQPWIARSAMLVAPMRLGAGIKNKILEALAMERPVITNATGAEALSREVKEVLIFAETEEEFAREAGRLLDDPDRRKALGVRGRAAMARHHSWDVAAEAYERLLEELAVKNR